MGENAAPNTALGRESLELICIMYNIFFIHIYIYMNIVIYIYIFVFIYIYIYINVQILYAVSMHVVITSKDS